MQIRKCTEKDIDKAVSFYDWVVLWLDRHINYPKWIYKVYPSEETVRESTAAGELYLCEEDGKIVGGFIINTDPGGNYKAGNWSKDLPEGSYMVLHSLAVDPENYRKGIGSEVIRFCEMKAEEEGFQAIRADIVPDNLPSRKMFEKNGFAWVGDADLERGLADIPLFSLYEKNIFEEGSETEGGTGGETQYGLDSEEKCRNEIVPGAPPQEDGENNENSENDETDAPRDEEGLKRWKKIRNHVLFWSVIAVALVIAILFQK